MKSFLPLGIACEATRGDVKAIPIQLRCPNGYVNIAHNKATAEKFLRRRIDFYAKPIEPLLKTNTPVYLAQLSMSGYPRLSVIM